MTSTVEQNTTPNTNQPVVLTLAPVSSRIIALVIDCLILFALNMILASVSFYFPYSSITSMVFLSLVGIVYESLLLINRGQTVGKMITKIAVVDQDGSYLTPSKAIIRSFVKYFPLLGFVLLLISLILLITQDQRQAIHDLVADSRVVYKKVS